MKNKHLFVGIGLSIATIFSAAAALTIGTVNHNETKNVEVAADYSSTIRVYVDLDWGNIDYVRLGTDQASGAAVLSSSNSKYNQSLGKYVRDISSGSTYDKMGCFFSQSGQWWQYQYDGGYVWISGGFKPGYEYQIKSIGYVSESGGVKYFAATPYEIGEITDNVSSPKVYFVNGYSWESVYVHYWGGTASSTYPGSAMTDTGLRLKAYVGETEYLLRIYEYSISGTCAYVQFNNNSTKTGDLRPVNGGVYWYGVDADTYTGVANLLVTLKSELGTYSYKGRSYTNSICNLSQSQAQSFVSTYNTLDASSDAKVKSSVEGSGLYTYTNPEVNNTTKGDVTLTEVKEALMKKYPAISGVNVLNFNSQNNSSAIVIVTAASLLTLSAVGGYFFLRKRKENN